MGKGTGEMGHRAKDGLVKRTCHVVQWALVPGGQLEEVHEH